ncbi:ArsR/SmtB family transcription factor [Micromonospora echinofusca]|uniref:Helix-turn-helix domain-containing protein n=1 Tax=Micromonospora echinofusca TaxID=47858 RepID=A0A1C5GGS8_MICEH|nr:helix-turn-helix domain-containing protein [Micromonospora echinofusca]SCG18995.1 Helix-turn-helix domain-containing protein [Micromonospora echinofusca]
MAAAPRVVSDVQTLKALADPARLAILELMMGDYARSWTAKELAAEIQMPPKKLYYHLGLLEQRGLLEVRATQVVNGIIEKHYGAGQRSITFQRGSGAAEAVELAPDTAEEMGQVVTTLFDTVHADILAGLRSGATVMHREAPDAKRVVVSYATAGMPPTRAGEFRAALLSVVEQFQAAAVPGEPRFELLVAIAPQSDTASATPPG